MVCLGGKVRRGEEGKLGCSVFTLGSVVGGWGQGGAGDSALATTRVERVLEGDGATAEVNAEWGWGEDGCYYLLGGRPSGREDAVTASGRQRRDLFQCGGRPAIMAAESSRGVLALWRRLPPWQMRP